MGDEHIGDEEERFLFVGGVVGWRGAFKML